MSTEQDLLDSVSGQLHVGGKWVDADHGCTFDVHDPATGSVLKSVADASVADGLRALDAASAAAAEWAAAPPRSRADVLLRAFNLVRARQENFALLITLEMGKPLAESRGEVAYGAEFLRWFGEEAVRLDGHYGTPPEGVGRMIVTSRPVGPCYLITPWNFPLAMATRKIGPAVAAGCTMVIKPANLTPLTTLALMATFEEAGLPAGVLNVITTTSAAEVSEKLIADPRLRKLSFTGSTPVGVSLMKQAADNVLRTSMELGGNAPFLVFDDADVDQAVKGALQAKFRNVGQACTAANRFLVQEGIADEFANRTADAVATLTVGRGTDAAVTIGPLIDERAIQNTERLLADARDRGATVLAGGARRGDGPGTFFQPTVIDDVTPEMALYQEEIFAPVVSIVRFGDEADGVRLANASDYGLVGYVYTSDFRRGQRMIDRLDTGMMGLNVGVVSNAAAPFGGVKHSGVGREGGAEGIKEYVETKYTLTADPYEEQA